jgi:hypothetical protein
MNDRALNIDGIDTGDREFCGLRKSEEVFWNGLGMDCILLKILKL